MEKHYVITIARGFGSGGKELGVQLAEELGINCYENRILELASKYSGVSEKEFAKVDEKLNAIKIRKRLEEMPNKDDIRTIPVSKSFASDINLFNIQAHIIRELADTESCVIVGKCADNILSNYSNVISLYIEAPRPYCRERVMKKYNCTEDEANRMIYQTDMFRAEYYKYYSGGNEWTNVTNYDLTINMARVGIDNAIQLIKDYMKNKFK